MTKQDIIKDCEKIIKEINYTNKSLKIQFKTENNNSFTKKKRLLLKNDNKEIVVIKDYISDIEDFEVNYKNNKFFK